MRVAVIVPTYQEALNVATVVTGVRLSLPDAQVVVVDDSSPDGTADIAKQLGEDLGRVHVIVRPVRDGFGKAYREGWTWALEHGFDVVVSMDADGSHDPAALPALLAPLDGGADLVVGSRYVAGGSVPGWAPHRRWLSRWGNRYAGAVLGVAVHDATGGYRAYRAALLQRIDVTTLRANGYAFQIELVYRSARLGATVVEAPITFIDRRLGTSKMSAAIIWEALGLVTWWGVRDRLLKPVIRRRRR